MSGTERSPRAPAVSVLIKSFNHAAYIAQCIESVLSQTFQDFEIVVIDDASTDETAAIVRRFADPRIDLAVNPRNLGISGAMNATLARARGRYLAILNSDDWSFPQRLERQAGFLDSHPDVALLFGLPRPVDERGQPTSAFNDFREPLSLPDFSRRTWLRKFFFNGNCLCAPTAMIRREAYGVGGYDRRLTNLQDLDMWIRMSLAGHNIHVLAEEVTAFRIRDNDANMSAARADSRMRTGYETSKILRHFSKMTDEDFEAVFGDEVPDTGVGSTVGRFAALALRIESAPHQLCALDALYENANDDEAYDVLRRVSGGVDVFGIEKAFRLEERLAEAEAGEAALDGPSHEPKGLLRAARRMLFGRAGA